MFYVHYLCSSDAVYTHRPYKHPQWIALYIPKRVSFWLAWRYLMLKRLWREHFQQRLQAWHGQWCASMETEGEYRTVAVSAAHASAPCHEDVLGSASTAPCIFNVCIVHMEVRGYVHSPAALTPRNDSTHWIRHGRAPETVCTRWQREKSVTLPGIETQSFRP